MNFYHALKYLEHIIFSGHRNGHGIHSPLVFDLVSRIFRNKSQGEVVLRIEKIRKKLLNDRRTIVVNDLGAGQQQNRSNIRKVSEIARYSAVPRKYGKLLSELASEFGNPSVIELGTSFGFSAMYMAAGNPGSIVYTIEGCSRCAQIAGENFAAAGISNIVLLNEPFDTALPGLSRRGVKPGLVFIDGNHRKEPVLRYFSQLQEFADEKTVIVIDDIYYSKEMTAAWNVIRYSENVSASIDIFRMGIVFLRRNITRNHYKIRY